MKIKDIISEELDFIAQEGVADTYGEKFGLSNPAKELDAVAKSGMEGDNSMGEYVGNFDLNSWGGNHKNSIINVYHNPRSLHNFDPDVRAVSDDKGNLFVAQTHGGYYHSMIAMAVNEGESGYRIPDAYMPTEAVTWHRIGNTDSFGFSISYVDFGRNSPVTAEKMVAVVKQKNPQFTFVAEYWVRAKEKENGVNPPANGMMPHDDEDYYESPSHHGFATLHKELHETGEANLPVFPFEFEHTALGYLYKFTAKNDNYVVQFARASKAENRVWDLSFEANEKGHNYMTNANIPLRIMSTIAQIVQDFAAKEHPNVIYYMPSKETDDDERRERLYATFILKALKANHPDYDLFKILDKYVIERHVNDLDAREVQKFLDHLTTVIKVKAGEYNYLISPMSIMTKQHDYNIKTTTFFSPRLFYQDYLNELEKQSGDKLQTTQATLNEIEIELKKLIK